LTLGISSYSFKKIELSSELRTRSSPRFSSWVGEHSFDIPYIAFFYHHGFSQVSFALRRFAGQEMAGKGFIMLNFSASCRLEAFDGSSNTFQFWHFEYSPLRYAGKEKVFLPPFRISRIKNI
jgi:hypothetical protein